MGYIKLHRAILEWGWCDEPNTLALWIHLLLEANWRDGEWHGEEVKRGQIFTSVAKLSVMTGITEKRVRTCLERLVKGGQIIKEGSSNRTKITVCKYDSYQSFDDEDEKPTGEQTAKETPVAPEQNAAPIDEEKKKRGGAIKQASERIYALYPSSVIRSEGNRSSLKSSKDKEKIVRMLSSGITEERLTYVIKRYLDENHGPYTKMFATLLNNLPDYGEEIKHTGEESGPTFSDKNAYIGEDGKVHTRTTYRNLADMDRALAIANRELEEWRKNNGK